MCVNRVALEVVREGTDEQLVEDTALVEVKVVRDLIIAPASEVARVVVDCVVTVATREADGIREDDTRDGVGRLEDIRTSSCEATENRNRNVKERRDVKKNNMEGRLTAMPTPGTMGSLASSATRPG